MWDDLDAFGLAAAIRDGQLSAGEAVEEALRRIEAGNGAVNAVVALRAEEALDEVRRGLPSGPLTGVPFLVKDLGTAVAGLPLTHGSRLFAGHVPAEDGELVRRYRRAGLVVLGASNSPEMGLNATTEPLLHGPTRNPFSPSHSAGGSSGGSAAAVATGMVPVAHASDGGGSIRIPSSACGLVGLKPTRGRTPARFAKPLSVHHVVARSVRDSALLLDVAAGTSPSPAPPPSPGRLRIGLSAVPPDGAHISVSPECADAAVSVARLLESLGHDVVEATPDYPVEALLTARSIGMIAPLVADVDARLAALGRELRDDDLEPFTRVLYDIGRDLRQVDVIGALDAFDTSWRAIRPFFDDHDLLLTPTIAQPPPPLGLLDTTDPDSMYANAPTYSTYTSPFNVTGQPAVSVPAAVSAEGLPIGAQLVARHGREDVLLSLAAGLEAAGWPAPL